jgi:methionyl-tRNA synthetase
MDKNMLKQAAQNAMKSLEGLDASKVKAVNIIFTDTSSKELREDAGDEMEDMDNNGEMEEDEGEGKVCPHCGKELK